MIKFYGQTQTNTNPKNTNFVQFYHKEKLMQQTLENFSSNLNTKCFEITEENIGIRADIFISQICGISRAKAQSYIKSAQVLLNNAPLQKHGITLKLHDTITLIPQEAPQQRQKKEFTIPILYEDEEILILNKPADLIVHRSDTQDTQYTLVDWLKDSNFNLSNLGDSYREGIVHRLDKGTSGAIVIAKNNTAHAHLSAQIKTRAMGRYYVCVIDKPIKEPQIIESPIMRHPKMRLKYITTSNHSTNAKPAKTAFFTIADSTNFTPIALIGAKLFSGRTHQIRVHLHSINRHILGDAFYGYKGNYTNRILLHAHFIHLIHPISKQQLEIYAPFSLEMQEFLETYFPLQAYKNPQPQSLTIPLASLYAEIFKT